MKKLLSKFSSLYFRLIISYIAVVVIVVCVSSVSFFQISTKQYEKEITQLNNELLNQLRQLCDHSIIEKVEKLAVNSFLWGDSTQSADFQDLRYLFDHPVKGNHDKIISAKMYLQQIAASQDDLIDSIAVYYRENGLLISSRNMKYLEDRGAIFEKSLLGTSSYQDSAGFSWINAPSPELGEWNQYNQKDLVTLYRPYPFTGIDSNAKGMIFVNLKREALLSAVTSLSPRNFGEILIVDDRGGILVETSPGLMDLFGDRPMELIEETKRNGSMVTEDTYQDMVISSTQSSINNWIYVRVMPCEKYFSLSAFLVKLVFILCVSVLLLGILLSNFFSLRLFKGIRRIVDLSQSFFDVNLKKGKDYYSKILEINESLHRLPYDKELFKTAFDNSLPLIRKNLLVDLLSSKPTPGKNDEILKQFQIPESFPYSAFHVILIDFMETVSLDKLIVEKEYMKLELPKLISKWVLSPIGFEVLDISMRRVCLFMNAAEKDSPCILEGLSRVFTAMEDSHGRLFRVGAGSCCCSLDEIHTSFSHAAQCLPYYYIYPREHLLAYHDTAEWEKKNDGFPTELYSEMDRQLRSGAANDGMKLLLKIKEAIQGGGYSFLYCQQILIEITNVFSRYLNDRSYRSETNVHDRIHQEFSQINDIDAYFEWLGSIVVMINELLSQKRDGRNQELANRAKEYIDRNVLSDLSLTAISDALYVSASNLSKIFREETGGTLIEYVIQVRLEYAREQLLTTRKSIDAIAAIAGYNNTSYFIKRFKEKYGYTPKQYRMEHNVHFD